MPALDSVIACRNWNDNKEEAAEWLGGELLVTSDMVLAVAQGLLTRQQVRKRFGVSDSMFTLRLNMAIASKRVKREQSGRRANKIRIHRGLVV